MALRGDDKGDHNGPGTMRDMERRDKTDGRSVLGTDGWRLSCGVDGRESRASDGSRGEEMVAWSGLRATTEGKRSFGESQGFSVRGDTPSTKVWDFLDCSDGLSDDCCSIWDAELWWRDCRRDGCLALFEDNSSSLNAMLGVDFR